MSVPSGALTKLGFGVLLSDDCHCCSKRVLILQFALVEMVAGNWESSWETHCWAQEGREVTRVAGSGSGNFGR